MRRGLAIAGGLAIAAVLLYWRIGAYPLTDADAASYAKMARNVAETGEVVVLRFNPDAVGSDVDKPPLGIWIMAASFAILGPTLFAVRFWHACLAALLLLVTAALGRRVAGRKGAIAAAAILLTSFLFFYSAREPLLEIPLTLCVTAVWLLLADADASPAWPRIWMACGMAAIGVLFKGPVAIALTLVPPVLLQFSARRPAWRITPRFVGGAVVGLGLIALIVLPWHVLAWLKAGRASFENYAGAVSWRYYLKPIHTPGLGLFAYSGLLLVCMCPWIGMVIPSLIAGVRRTNGSNEVRMLSYAVLWALVFWGVSPTMIFGKYLLPVVPALAVVIAWWLQQPMPRGTRSAAWTTILTGVLLTPASIVAALSGPPGLAFIAGVTLALLGLIMIAGGIVLQRGSRRVAIRVLAGGTAAAWMLLLGLALPAVETLYPEYRMADRINHADGAAAHVVVYRPDSLEAMLAFYLKAPRVEYAHNDAELGQALKRRGPTWIVERGNWRLPSEFRDSLELVDREEMVRLWRTRQ